MRVQPIAQANPDRRVHFNDVVEVRYYTPEETHEIQPTLDAVRIERAVKSKTIQNPHRFHAERDLKRAVSCWKNTYHTISIVCGLCVLPSLACLALGPIGLVVPAALLITCVIATAIGGKPTPEMQEWLDKVHKNIANTDWRGTA